jgi:hypothetical protein
VFRAAVMLGLSGTTIAVLIALLAPRVAGAAPELRGLGALLLVTVWAPFLAAFAGRPKLAAMLFTLPVALGTPLVAMRALPAMQDYVHTRAVAGAMDRSAPAHAPLVLVDPPPPSLRLGLARNLRVADPPGEALAEARTDDGFAYVAFRPAREREMRRELGPSLDVLHRTPLLVLARVAPTPQAPR